MQTIEEINAYLKVQGVRLEFDSIQDLVTAYLQNVYGDAIVLVPCEAYGA